MRFVLWILVFVLALSFAVKNTDSVVVRYYLGIEWSAPLVIVLLAVFCAGVAAGVAANLPYVFRLRRDVSRLKRAQPAPPQPSAER
jgi:lipopolysaccharide assembly protein A